MSRFLNPDFMLFIAPLILPLSGRENELKWNLNFKISFHVRSFRERPERNIEEPI